MTPTLIDWTLTGGYRRLVVWRTDTTGVSLSTGVARVLEQSSEPTRAPQSDGTLRTDARSRAVAVGLFGWPQVATLRRWARDAEDDPDVRVRAVLVAAGRGTHLVWDEAVPPVLTPLASIRGDLTGDALLLHTGRYHAYVHDSPNLLAGRAFGPGGDWTASSGTVTWGVDADGAVTAQLSNAVLSTSVVLPAPGLAVGFAAEYLTDFTLDARIDPRRADGTFAGGALSLGPGPAEVAQLVTTLPHGVWSVRLEVSGTGTFRLPALLTRRVDGSYVAPVVLAEPGGSGGGGAPGF